MTTKYRQVSMFVVAVLVTGSCSAHGHGGMGGGMGGGIRSGGGSGFGTYNGGSPSDFDRDNQGRIRYHFNRNNVFGWALMPVEEQASYGEKMLSFTTYEECNAYQGQHHGRMEVRAKEQAITLSEANYSACDRMEAKGFFK